MHHIVINGPNNTVLVAYLIPGTTIASIVCDLPAGLRADANALAARLTRESAPQAPIIKQIPSGFYTDESP